jgi:hypothetical protein
MQAALQAKRGEIEQLCRRFHVRQLDVFGSAVSGAFDPAHSDIDLLVEFDTLPPRDYAEAYFGLREALEGLLGFPVDLVTTAAVKNPFFRESLQRSRQALYAA